MNMVATLAGMRPKMCGAETRQVLTFEIVEEGRGVPMVAQDLQEEMEAAAEVGGLPAMPLVEVFKARRWTSVAIAIQDPLHSGHMNVRQLYGGDFVADFSCRLLEMRATRTPNGDTKVRLVVDKPLGTDQDTALAYFVGRKMVTDGGRRTIPLSIDLEELVQHGVEKAADLDGEG